MRSGCVVPTVLTILVLSGVCSTTNVLHAQPYHAGVTHVQSTASSRRSGIQRLRDALWPPKPPAWKMTLTKRLDTQDYSNTAPLIGILTEPCSDRECDYGKYVIHNAVGSTTTIHRANLGRSSRAQWWSGSTLQAAVPCPSATMTTTSGSKRCFARSTASSFLGVQSNCGGIRRISWRLQSSSTWLWRPTTMVPFSRYAGSSTVLLGVLLLLGDCLYPCGFWMASHATAAHHTRLFNPSAVAIMYWLPNR